MRPPIMDPMTINGRASRTMPEKTSPRVLICGFPLQKMSRNAMNARINAWAT